MKKKTDYYQYLQYSAIGLEMAGSVIVGYLIGSWLDDYFGIAPWMTILWTAAGLIAGFRSLFRLGKKYLQQNKNNHDQRPD